jgi:tetratricopeptide (TPR) repeat protein
MGRSRVIAIFALMASLVLGGATGSVSGPVRAQSLQAAQALEMAGRKDAALVAYTAIIESWDVSRDERARALFARALLLDGMNRLSDALQDYGGVVQLSPKFAAAWNNRANIYRRQRHWREARRDYQAALAAGNRLSLYSYYGLGQIAEAEGDRNQARVFYAKALDVAPDFLAATQRIAALDTPEPIHLHPPAKSREAEDPAAPIVLRPPKMASEATVHLRPPTSAPVPVPAAYEAPPSPTLKPALDQGAMGGQVQLGAWRTEAEAAQGWNRAVEQAGGVLEGYSPHIVVADLPGAGRYYRLRVSTDGSKTLCTALLAKGLACIPARD